MLRLDMKYLIVLGVVMAVQSLLLLLEVPGWLNIAVLTPVSAGGLYWSRPPIAVAVTRDGEQKQAEHMAVDISQATSKMATGAAEVSYYIDGLVKDIKHSGNESAEIVDASRHLTVTSGELNTNLQTITQTINQTASACQAAYLRWQGRCGGYDPAHHIGDQRRRATAAVAQQRRQYSAHYGGYQ